MFITIYNIDRDGVKTVRLVLNGSQQKNYGSLFATTPSREELLCMLHTAATRGWDIIHVDEKSCFLSAVLKIINPPILCQ